MEVGKPGPNEARVKHTAIGLNMIDTYMRRGWYKPDLPFTPGNFTFPALVLHLQYFNIGVILSCIDLLLSNF